MNRIRRRGGPAMLLWAAAALACTPTLHAQSRDRGTLVVVNKDVAAANIIDLATGRIVKTLPTGDGPHEAAISSDGRTAAITDYGLGGSGGNSLTVIDVPGLAVARTVDLGRYRRPHGIAFLPGDSLIAVTSEATRNVVLVRVADGTILRTISTEQRGSHMLAVTGAGRRLYTGNTRDNTISELDLQLGRRTNTFAVPPRPEAITVTPDGAEVWVGSNAEGTVSVVRPATGEVQTMLEGFGWPYRILITPDQRRVLVPDLRRHELRIAERGSGRELARLSFPGGGPQGITLSGDAETVFLSLRRRNRIAVIDLESLAVVRYIDTGRGPDGIAYSPLVMAP